MKARKPIEDLIIFELGKLFINRHHNTYHLWELRPTLVGDIETIVMGYLGAE